jgi:hypothetical protein
MPAPRVWIQSTATLETGFPLASLAWTTIGSKNRKILNWHVWQITCPLPDTMEMFATVCADAVGAHNSPTSIAANTTNLSLAKISSSFTHEHGWIRMDAARIIV